MDDYDFDMYFLSLFNLSDITDVNADNANNNEYYDNASNNVDYDNEILPYLEYMALNESMLDNNNTQQGGANPTFKIVNQHTNDNMGILQRVYEIENLTTRQMTFSDAIVELDTFFDDLIKQFVTPLNDRQQIQFIFNHDLLRESISIGYLRKNSIDKTLFKSEFSKVGQSLKFNDEQTDQIFTVTITTITTPTGGSKTKLDPLVRIENIKKRNAKRSSNKNKKRIEQIFNQELLNKSSENNLESLLD
jgi:hypothetical protein